MRRLLRSLIFFSIIAAPLAKAQSFGETVEVRIANIDVVVTTKGGGKVSGLQAKDFELLVDGKPREISNFYEVKGASAVGGTVPPRSDADAVPARRRANVILFIDLYSLELRQRQQAIDALKTFVSQSLQPEDRVMIAVWNRQLSLPVPFTTDRSVVFSHLDRLARGGQAGLERDRRIAAQKVLSALESAQISATVRRGGTTFPEAYQHALEMARAHGEEQAKLTKLLAESLEELLRVVAGVDGKRMLVLLGENFPKFPIVDFYQHINDVFIAYSAQIRMVSPPMEASKYSLADIPGRIARVANANEVTIHAIYSGVRPSDENVESQYGGATLEQQFLEFSNTANSYAHLASETGGAAIVGSTNFELAARQLFDDMNGYYSIAYRVPAGETGSRRIEVRLPSHPFSVRARRTYVPKSVDQEIADRVTSQLVLSEGSRPNEISVMMGTAKRAGRGKMTVPVQISFPSSLLTILPQGDRVTGGFEIVIVSRDDQNRLSEISRQVQTFDWPAAEIPQTVQRTIDLVLRDRPGAVSVGVVDRLTKQLHHEVIEVGRIGD